MGFAKNHPAVVAMFNSHKTITTELNALKADKATFDESANVRAMLERLQLQLSLRLGEWGWKVDGGTLVPAKATCADGLDAPPRKTGTQRR